MNDNMQPQSTQQPEDSVKDRVFSTIVEEQVTPRSKYVFWCQNGVVWALWGTTVLLGALATAVLLFTSTYRYYDIYEAMHENFVTFFVQALPVLWVVAFIVLMFAAVRGLRATKRGYRLSPLWVGSSSVGLSLLFGFVGNALGFGYVVDSTLGEYAPMYYSQAEREVILWQQPTEGRLLGAQARVIDQATVVFVDSKGLYWDVVVSELRPLDRELLAEKQRVRLLGQQVSGGSNVFYACGVFPWLMDKKRSRKDLSANRREMIEKLYKHMDTPTDRLHAVEAVTFTNTQATSTPVMGRCAEIAAVRRISEVMHK